ncbi:XkdW family protein [Bacillus atrophaeus]|uniref:XkdW family protein n=1 Tax=Bacillus atrophaeus TaxID=1452 RepID=UPI002E2428DB|nr:XkdW family protein [Bacillus atrophaeus]MED4814248.1 XkdW family protein [Bacillus atrophaeus]MED4826258.1 XkdW family protein [Bacillus atrophaeus]MED4844918.1 XkdW family protein [Bacillus atrophaeus]
MNLGEAILYKYPNADPTTDFIIQNNGDGTPSYIAQWNMRAPIPTEADLQAWWDELKQTPSFEPPDQIQLQAQELSEEKLARKQLEELNQTLGRQLSEMKLAIMSWKEGDESK